MVIFAAMNLRTYFATKEDKLADLAQRVGVTPAAMYRYVAGARVPRREIMFRIERETGGEVKPADFFAPPSSEAAA